ncbi:hypothetical protein [Companilactobacillus sp. DQM5]|uniref:hypothetical protein n=1 Tax=Companilactobacillus sp. DQM5 TaxID=3463359 RepID=UPI0040597B84
MKRKITITVLITFLLIVSGVLFSQHDNIKYKSVLNRNGISEEALILKTASNETIINGINKLSKKKNLSFKLHFISKKNPDISYYYCQNEKMKLPITKGRGFSYLDFKAGTSFVVAGKDVKDIYKPQEQAYINVNNQFLPVVGVVSADKKSNLNKHIFISISPYSINNLEKINDYRIVLDGISSRNKQKTLKSVKNAFSSKKAVNSVNKINNVKQKLIEKDKFLILILIFVTVIIAILNFNLLIPMKYLINNSQLNGDLQNDFKVGLIFQYILYNILSFVFSYFFIQKFIVIINQTQFLTFFVINIIVSIILGCYVIFTKNRRLIH